MKIAQDILEIKLAWKKHKELEETKQKCHDFLLSQHWRFCNFEKSYYKDDQVIDFPVTESSNSALQFCIGNVNYPIKNFDVIKGLLLQVIQCADIESLEIRDKNLKESKREFIDFLHELGHTYDEGEWHLLKERGRD